MDRPSSRAKKLTAGQFPDPSIFEPIDSEFRKKSLKSLITNFVDQYPKRLPWSGKEGSRPRIPTCRAPAFGAGRALEPKVHPGHGIDLAILPPRQPVFRPGRRFSVPDRVRERMGRLRRRQLTLLQGTDSRTRENHLVSAKKSPLPPLARGGEGGAPPSGRGKLRRSGKRGSRSICPQGRKSLLSQPETGVCRVAGEHRRRKSFDAGTDFRAVSQALPPDSTALRGGAPAAFSARLWRKERIHIL